MKKAAIAILGLIILYLVGPSPSTPEYEPTLPEVPSIEFLEEFVEEEDRGLKLKPGNDARIIWNNDSARAQTDVAIVYLHGFTASREEGESTHRKVAEAFGCNLYLARLDQHGIDTEEALLEYTVEGVWQSAKKAYAIGKKLGKEVIIMSTSTGGTLALKLAATYPEIKGLINYSPNIEINDPAAFLLNDPWGLQIARIVFDGNYRELDTDDEYKKYWYSKYRLESIVELQELMETAATDKVFKEVSCPVFNGVYYKDEENQDEVVRVSAVREMHETISTPENLKELVEFPEAGAHVIAYDKTSGAAGEVRKATIAFMQEKLGLSLVKSTLE